MLQRTFGVRTHDQQLCTPVLCGVQQSSDRVADQQFRFLTVHHEFVQAARVGVFHRLEKAGIGQGRGHAAHQVGSGSHAGVGDVQQANGRAGKAGAGHIQCVA